jgi:TetR/AcrR family transcriptional repressor of nem operon
MVRYPAKHKPTTRAGIVSLAAERLRADGIAAVGVRQLMADAGLTHGAFYAHFRSRSELVGEAVAEASRSTLKYLEEAAAAAPADGRLAAIVATYLDRRHLDQTAKGCAAAALGSELAREDRATRAGFWEQNDRIIALLGENLPGEGNEPERMMRAIAIFAGLMGTLQLARIAKDNADVDDILAGGKRSALLLAQMPMGDGTGVRRASTGVTSGSSGT